MKLTGKFNRTLASIIAISLTVTPAMAKSADGLQDLIGARASSGESELTARGWTYYDGNKSDTESFTHWWHASRKDCIRVTTRDGRYAAIEDAKNSDCGQKSDGSGVGVAAAAVGAVAIAALLLSRKGKDKPNNDSGYQQDWQTVEAYGLQTGRLKIFSGPSKNERVRAEVPEGTVLRNYGCDDYGGESWCEVRTMNGRTTGWARDRYLRVTYGNGSGGGNGWGNSGDLVEVYGLQSGTLQIMAGPSKNEYVVGRVNTGTALHRNACQSSGGENWCQVATLDYRMSGWARERYLRGTSGGGYYPPGNGGNGGGGNWGSGGNWGGGNADYVEVYGLSSGTLQIMEGPSKDGYVRGTVGSGTTLRRGACQSSGGENWCQVSTLDGRVSGWARERYLRNR